MCSTIDNSCYFIDRYIHKNIKELLMANSQYFMINLKNDIKLVLMSFFQNDLLMITNIALWSSSFPNERRALTRKPSVCAAFI